MDPAGGYRSGSNDRDRLNATSSSHNHGYHKSERGGVEVGSNSSSQQRYYSQHRPAALPLYEGGPARSLAEGNLGGAGLGNLTSSTDFSDGRI